VIILENYTRVTVPPPPIPKWKKKESSQYGDAHRCSHTCTHTHTHTHKHKHKHMQELKTKISAKHLKFTLKRSPICSKYLPFVFISDVLQHWNMITKSLSCHYCYVQGIKASSMFSESWFLTKCDVSATHISFKYYYNFLNENMFEV